MSSEVAPALCYCAGFKLWYVLNNYMPQVKVCECGHRQVEHLDMKGSCMGSVEFK